MLIETQWYADSAHVIRRCALDEIKGFPAGSLVEDTTSSRLLATGWKTTRVYESLQFGKSPDTLQGHIKLRTRQVSP